MVVEVVFLLMVVEIIMDGCASVCSVVHYVIIDNK